MLLLTLRGTPFLFQGDELGLHDVEVPPERVVDVDGRDPVRSRCPGTPVGRGPGRGIHDRRRRGCRSPPMPNTWLPVQAEDPRSMLALYRALLRCAAPACAHEATTARWTPATTCSPSSAAGPCAVALNFAPSPAGSGAAGGQAVALDAPAAQRGGRSTGRVELAPDEGVIVELR